MYLLQGGLGERPFAPKPVEKKPLAPAPQAASGDAPAPEPKKFLGFEPITWAKILPLGAMFFCILFNYTILRDTKVRGGGRRASAGFSCADCWRFVRPLAETGLTRCLHCS